MKITMANGKMKFAGKLASTCTIGCMNWATRGLKPIHTPTGTQTSEETVTTTTTRRKVRKPRPNAVPNTPSPCVPVATKASMLYRPQPSATVSTTANATSAARRRASWLARLWSSMPVARAITALIGWLSARLPRPSAVGQLDLRSASSTSDFALSSDSDCSTRNLST